MEKSKYLTIFWVFVLIVGVIILWLWQKPYKYEGNLIQVREQVILVQGNYATAKEENKELMVLEVKIDESTKIIKNSFALPADGSMVKMDELPKKEKQVNFETLKNDSKQAGIGLFIELKRNIFGYVRPVAKEIKYLVPEF